MRVVITYGTYQLLNSDQIRFLKKARSFGDFLVLGLSTDRLVDMKNEQVCQPYNDRKEVLEALRYVDLVVPEESWNQRIDDIKRFDADILVLDSEVEGYFDYLQEFCEVTYLDL